MTGINIPKKHFKLILIVGVVLIILGYFAYGQLLSVMPFRVPSFDQNISNWKTYRDDKHGIEFKYPKNYKLSSELSGQIVALNLPAQNLDVNSSQFKDSLENSIFLYIYVNYGGWTLTRLMNESGNKFDLTTAEKLTINGVDMYRSYSQIIVQKDNFVLVFKGGADKLPQIFDKILSTFRFTN
ncbi:MAG: hypothetical protein Q8R55_00875 [Candidatus Taylorbacteria bacterium]|nr:hypothetical protein [Candidatus Taylorbacteria bacterium]